MSVAKLKSDAPSRCAARSSRRGSSCRTSRSTVARRCAANYKKTPRGCPGEIWPGSRRTRGAGPPRWSSEVSEGAATRLDDLAPRAGYADGVTARRAAADGRRRAGAPEIAAPGDLADDAVGSRFGVGVALTLSRLVAGVRAAAESGSRDRRRRGVRGGRSGGHLPGGQPKRPCSMTAHCWTAGWAI